MTADLDVLYIAGYVRSGSTLLDRLLGTLEGFLPLGELSLVWEYGFAQDRPCSCGASFRRCAFWNAVAEDAFGGMGGFDVDEIVRTRRRVDRWWRTPMLLGSDERDEDLARHLRTLTRLYRSIREVSGCRVIVDSTKEATQLRFLSAIDPPVRLTVVHLIRDSRGVTFSLSRRDKLDPATGRGLGRHSTVHAAAAWTATNVLIEAAVRDVDRRMRLRYEELARDPRGSLGRIVSLLGLDVAIPAIDGSVELRADHSVAGNPMRFDRGTISIAPDDEWSRRMPRRSRALVTGLTWPLLAAYGQTGRRGPRTPVSVP